MAILFGNKSRCPDCGAIAFGVLHIARAWNGADGATWACEACGTSYNCWLPKLQKKVLYLDQCALSLMLKATQTGVHSEWSTLHGLLTKMVSGQQIVCPSSWHHREESEFSKQKFDGLMKLSRAIATANRLVMPWDIHAKQLQRALEAYLKDEVVDLSFPSLDAFRDDPNAWHEQLSIHVLRGRDEVDVASRKETKDKVHDIMTNLYADPAYMQRSFEEHVKHETDGYAGAIIDAYNKMNHERSEARCGTGQRLLLPPHPAAAWVYNALARIHGAIPEINPTEKITDYFYSPQFATVPFVRINAVLRAAMAIKTRDSSRKPRASDMYDLEILSAYLPYCDAMLLDGEMRSLACEGKAHLDQTYHTQLFSARDLPALFKWLDVVESSCPKELKLAISDLYEGRFDEFVMTKGRNLHEGNAWDF